MKKIMSMIAILCIAFLVAGCRPGGQAIAGQMSPENYADSMPEYEPEQYDTGDVAPESYPTYYEEPIQEIMPQEVGTGMDCMVQEVTVPPLVVEGIVGQNDQDAVNKCYQALAMKVWSQADSKCKLFKKEDMQTQCRASSGNVNMDKDFEMKSSEPAPNGGVVVSCRLINAKDFVCNGH